MKIRMVDNTPEFSISAGQFGDYHTDTGVLEVPDDLPAWALVPGLHEIVLEVSPRTRRVFKATPDEPPAPESPVTSEEDND